MTGAARTESTDVPRSVRLEVARARPADMGRGVARLGQHALGELGLREGDVVEIRGRRSSAAIALHLPYEDRGLPLLRIDGLQRANAAAAVGERVLVTAVSARQARRVVLASIDVQPPASTRTADALRQALLGRPVIAGDVIATFPLRRGSDASSGGTYGLHEVRLRVVSTFPADGVVTIGDATAIELLADASRPDTGARSGVTYDDLGGLGGAIQQVREIIEVPLRHPELFRRLGIDPPKGVLLHGPPGTGKTLLARAVANEADARFFHIAGPEIMGSHVGESEERLRAIFEKAKQSAPAIVFIDEIDSIAPKREQARGEAERRVVAQLLTLMDGLESRGNVVVVGATNLVDQLDEALRRPGRFDREIALGVPDREGRREVLAIHTRGMPLAAGVDLDEIARQTNGFTGADLAALVREAALGALRRVLPGVDPGTSDLPPTVLDELRVLPADIAGALKRVHPSAMREIMIQLPEIGWDDIGGLAEAKAVLRDGIELPLKEPEAFRRLGIPACKGFLLYGPPGTGKTLLAKAVAHEAEANFIAARSSDLLSKWYGESERQITRLFARARQVAPAVIFLDEIDALAPERGAALGEPAVTERVVNTLLSEMDGLEELHGVVVIGATNRPTLLDPALLRPGRFDELIYIAPPDRDARLHILRALTKRVPLAADVDLQVLAERTHSCTGADLADLVRRAGLAAFRDDREARAVPMVCFERALSEVRPSVTPEIEREYEDMVKELRRESPRGRWPIGFHTPTADG